MTTSNAGPGELQGSQSPPVAVGAVASTSAANTASQSQDIPGWLWRAGRGSWSLIGIGILIVAVVAATAQVTPVFIAVFAALVFTSVLNPVVNRLAKHMNRGLAVLLSMLGLLFILLGLVGFVVSSVAGQWSRLGRELAQGVDKITEFLEDLPFLHVNLSSDQLYQWMNEKIAQGIDYAQHNWQELASAVLSNAGGVFISITIFFVGVFVTIFFLLSGAQMWRWFLNLLPTDKRAAWNHGAQAGWATFAGYARGTMIIAFIDGVAAFLFLEIVRIPLAPALGVLVMIGAFIPMVGAPAAMILAMIVALATKGVWAAIIVGLGIALIGQIEGHILQPLIMGKQVALSPVVVILGVAAGTLVAGLLGAIIAIPIISVTWAVFSSLYHRDPPIVGPLPNLPDRPPTDVGETEIPQFMTKVVKKDSSDKKSPKKDPKKARGKDTRKKTRPKRHLLKKLRQLVKVPRTNRDGDS